MAGVSERHRPAGLAVDPVCGTLVLEEGANQFFDGLRTRYFCSAMCRRIFIDERRAQEAARARMEERPGHA